jgi:hypothetical protein
MQVTVRKLIFKSGAHKIEQLQLLDDNALVTRHAKLVMSIAGISQPVGFWCSSRSRFDPRMPVGAACRRDIQM